MQKVGVGATARELIHGDGKTTLDITRGEVQEVGEDFKSGCSKLNFQETAGHNQMEISKKGSHGKESGSGNINEILENEKRAETKVGGNMTGCHLDFSLSKSSKTYWFISVAVAPWGL
ncbi:hypothetical protein V6N12_061430 [Hibiscus sabdariffa]|uniref:Uncharacterized protein n=1 Tax=Hibiscus sabdariffa TaxID=183260 RepID=A0ABR2DX15_9ROSI